MNTLILSGSVSENSRSFLLCKAVEKQLLSKGNTITFVDARKIPMNPAHREITDEMRQLAEQVKQADNIIIGMGVHCYSVIAAFHLLFLCVLDSLGFLWHLQK